MKYSAALLVMSLGVSSASADDIRFGFRSDSHDIVDNQLILITNFVGTIDLYLTAEIVDQGGGAVSVGGFGGAITQDAPLDVASLRMRGGNWREFEGIDLDIPATKMGMVHPFRDLFGPIDAVPGGNDNGVADNQFATLVGFDLATNGVGDLDGAVGVGDNNDLYKFSIDIDNDGEGPRIIDVEFASNEGVNNVNQLIFEDSPGIFRYEVVDGGDAQLRIILIPAPGALALLGIGGFAAARRRRA